MPRAFVCINLETGLEAKILQQLKKLKGVEEAFLVYGVCDIIVKVNADTMNKLNELVFLKIRRLEGIRSALTMVILE